MKKIILFLLMFRILYSHPHVFLDTKYQIKILNENLIKVTLNFELDELSSAIVKDNENASELCDKILEDLKVYYNGKKIKGELYSKKMKMVKDEILIYLDLYFKVKIKKNDRFKIAIYDEIDYFYEYDYEESSFKVENNIKEFKISAELKENENESFYFDSVYPQEMEVKFL